MGRCAVAPIDRPCERSELTPLHEAVAARYAGAAPTSRLSNRPKAWSVVRRRPAGVPVDNDSVLNVASKASTRLELLPLRGRPDF